MVITVRRYFMAPGRDFLNQVRQPFSDPAQNKKGSSELFAGFVVSYGLSVVGIKKVQEAVGISFNPKLS